MKLAEIFEKDPSRTITKVVMVDQHRGDVVSTEIEEYVATEQICSILQDIVDQFLETRQGREAEVCAWISGFFGSGKSHLAKMLGYILSNRDVVSPDGLKINAADYFSKKHGLKGTNILTGELKTRALFYNMLKFERAREEDLCRFIYRSLLKDLGFSEVPWVAEIEYGIQQEGLWDDFKRTVKREAGRDWEDIREKEVQMRPTLIKALTLLKPEIYPNYEVAQQAVQDQKDEFILGTERLVKRLLDEAIRLDEVEGRVVLILDEVGLYLRSADASGLTELNSLAEDLERVGKGKIWLFATAQEALEAVAPDLSGRREQIGWLQDRFPLKFSLLPKNIPTVVNARLLAKNHESAAFKELEKKYKESSGQLVLGARIENAAHDTEKFSSVDYDAFSDTYPLLPYHIDVMINIFSRLRAKGRSLGQDTKLAGRERAVLSVVQSMILELVNRDADVGALATFDLLYDSVDTVLQVVSSDEDNLITEKIEQMGEVEGLKVSNVAKALFLLQQVDDWIPCSLSNIGAVLYPGLGVSPHEHLSKVKKCLELLVSHRWVKEEEGKYRFLSEVERSFEEEVSTQIQLIRTSEVEEKVFELASESLKDLKNYHHMKMRLFDVAMQVDNREVTKKGYLKLKVYSPLWASQRDDPVDDAYLESLGKEDTVIWVSRLETDFIEKTKRFTAIERVLDDWTKRARTPQQLGELETYRKELNSLKGYLPELLQSSLLRGTVLLNSEREDLDGKKAVNDVYEKWIRQLTEQLFTRFNEGAVNIPKDDIIEAVLRWQGGPLPPAYKELKLVDSDQRNILTNGPVAHTILLEVRKRGEANGGEITDHFDKPPFGWDERVIRTALAALFKTGSIQAAPAENTSFTARRNFRATVFSVGVAPSKEEKEEARLTLSEKFGLDTGVTTEQISETILQEAKSRVEAITKLVSTDGYYRLPYVDEITVLRATFDRLVDQPSPSHRVKALLVPEVKESLETHLPLFSSVDGFVKGEGLALYLAMRDFSGPPLESLERLNSSSVNEAVSFRAKLLGKNLLKEWGDIYDRYRQLKESYKKEYLSTHKRVLIALGQAKDSLRDWAKAKQIDSKKVEEIVEGWSFLGCTSGKDGTYDETKSQCSACNRSLTALLYYETLIPGRLEEAKKNLFELITDEKTPVFEDVVKKSITVTGEKELGDLIEEVTDFSNYWLAQGKRIRLKVEGEARDG